jgi:hypothetical protein
MISAVDTAPARMSRGGSAVTSSIVDGWLWRGGPLSKMSARLFPKILAIS